MRGAVRSLFPVGGNTSLKQPPWLDGKWTMKDWLKFWDIYYLCYFGELRNFEGHTTVVDENVLVYL